MKTIFINTSKEAKRTKLDVLFNAPFDHNTLLCYECKINEISEMASIIKKALITDADTVDRDYNLIVLVDMYEFPRGDEIEAVNLYKQLVTHYVGATLVNRLNSEVNLCPVGTAIYYTDSSSKCRNYIPEYDNEIQKSEKNKEKKLSKIKASPKLTSEDDLSVEDFCGYDDVNEESKETPDNEAYLIAELFGWKDKMKKTELSWKLRCSVSEEDFLDFTDVFRDISCSVEKSHERASVIDVALGELKKFIICSEKGVAGTKQAIEHIKSYYITVNTCKFNRDNEQSLKEGFFKAYANIYACIQSGKICADVIEYTENEIRTLLVNALNKYNYFSDEEKIEVDMQPVAAVFEKRSELFKRHRKMALEKSQHKDDDEEKIAESIMSSSGKEKSVQMVETSKLRGVDLQFYSTVEEIFGNYDTEVIKKQNDLIVKNCMLVLWEWRDRCTNEDFCRLVEAGDDAFAENIKTDGEKPVCDSVAFLAEEHEAEYNRLIGEITEVEHRLSANKNILLETQNTAIEYDSWMKKGKNYLVSFIGAVVAVLASGIPFIYMQMYSEKKMLVPVLVFLIFTLGFSLIYAIASGIYMSAINRRKYELKVKLDRLREESETDRKESIIALYRYYNSTIVEANCHYLLWQELLRREKENSCKEIMRNAHIAKLKELRETVERYLTMLKIDASEYTCNDEYKNLVLMGQEPFCSENNKKIYSILPVKQSSDNLKSGGEELQ